MYKKTIIKSKGAIECNPKTIKHHKLYTRAHGIFTKRWVYGIAKLILFLLILFICLSAVHNVLKRKFAYQKTEDFFKQEENFNVLFLGSSHMLNGVFPMQLWNDYGIISYNMGNYGERLVLSYYNLLLALEETNKPKLVVIDSYMVHHEDKLNKTKKVESHYTLDAYPVSYIKYLAVKDLFDGKDLIDKSMEYLFNFSLYHSRWNELMEEDFIIRNKYEKGAESRIKIAETKNIKEFNSVEEYSDIETVNMQYLRKIIEYCQQKDIDILVTYIPYPANEVQTTAAKYVENICSEYEVNYINFLSLDMVNYEVDLYDTEHLNPSGARKVTDYLGQYIMENYDIPDQRKNDSYNFWYEDYDEYIDLKTENLEKNKKNLNNYLMLLYGEEDIKYEIKISSKKEINEGTTLYELLKNLDNNYQIDDTAFKENKNKTIKITTWDNRTGEKIDTVWF